MRRLFTCWAAAALVSLAAGCATPMYRADSQSVPHISRAEALQTLTGTHFTRICLGAMCFNTCGATVHPDRLYFQCGPQSLTCPYASLAEPVVKTAVGVFGIDLRPECNVQVMFEAENLRSDAIAWANALYVLKHPSEFPDQPSPPPAPAPPRPPAPAGMLPEPSAAPAAAPASEVDAPRRRGPENPDDFAVVVGVEKYSNDLPDARFAERDAKAVREHLAALGTPERNIKLLLGPRASKSSLEAYIEDWLPRNVKPSGRVFFYFSGHGAPDPRTGKAFLVPFDGDPNYLDKTAYPAEKLYASLAKLPVRQVFVALDSCFSGAGGRSVLAEGARPLVNVADAAMPSGGRLTVFAAAAPTEITATLNDQAHGLFTYYFLKGLAGGAADSSGAVTVRGLYDYLKPKVQDAASRQNRDQTPSLSGASDRTLVPAR